MVGTADCDLWMHFNCLVLWFGTISNRYPRNDRKTIETVGVILVMDVATCYSSSTICTLDNRHLLRLSSTPIITSKTTYFWINKNVIWIKERERICLKFCINWLADIFACLIDKVQSSHLKGIPLATLTRVCICRSVFTVVSPSNDSTVQYVVNHAPA